MSSNEFKPGLEGVVAVETEIMEPDREGGTLRYRGVDVEPLIGEYPYENIWGLLVDDDIHSRHAASRALRARGHAPGSAPADLQAQTARLSGLWGLGKLNEISDDQAREDLGRISAADDVDRRPVGRGSPTGTRTRFPPRPSSRARRRRSGSCSSGAATPIPRRSRRSTRTGSARPSTG